MLSFPPGLARAESDDGGCHVVPVFLSVAVNATRNRVWNGVGPQKRPESGQSATDWAANMTCPRNPYRAGESLLHLNPPSLVAGGRDPMANSIRKPGG
jgi:hypothetical protein